MIIAYSFNIMTFITSFAVFEVIDLFSLFVDIDDFFSFQILYLMMSVKNSLLNSFAISIMTFVKNLWIILISYSLNLSCHVAILLRLEMGRVGTDPNGLIPCFGLEPIRTESQEPEPFNFGSVRFQPTSDPVETSKKDTKIVLKMRS
jgi:hypothetical protein